MITRFFTTISLRVNTFFFIKFFETIINKLVKILRTILKSYKQEIYKKDNTYKSFY